MRSDAQTCGNLGEDQKQREKGLNYVLMCFFAEILGGAQTE